MKKFLSKHLLVAAVAVGSCNLHADSSCGVKSGTCSSLSQCTTPSACAKRDGGKTYINLYPHWSPNDTSCHRGVGSEEDSKDTCGATVDFTGFYARSGGHHGSKCNTNNNCGVKASDLGVYFGLANQSTFVINNGATSINLNRAAADVLTTSGIGDAVANILISGALAGSESSAAAGADKTAAAQRAAGPNALVAPVPGAAFTSDYVKTLSDAAINKAFVNSAADQNVGLTLDPVQKAWGVTVNYHQDLNKLYKGLYLEVSAPIVHVEREVNATVRSLDAATVTDATKQYVKSYVDYFNGNDAVSPAVARTNRVNLSGAAVAGAGEVSFFPVNIDTLQNATLRDTKVTGLADLDCKVGYRFLDSDWYDLGLYAGLTIPTGNRSKGEELFEAIVGNGGHFALGAGLRGGVHVWGDDKKDNSCFNVFVHSELDYRYNFKATERRTLGLKNMNGASQWALVGQLDTTANFLQSANGAVAGGGAVAPANAQRLSSLLPLANVSTMDVDVTPGSQVNFNLSVGTGWEGFTVDLGYHLFFREEEEVKMKSGAQCPAFPANLVVDPLTIASLCGTFTNTSQSIGGNLGAAGAGDGIAHNVGANPNRVPPVVLTTSDLDPVTAQTPSVLTNGIYGSLGYTFKEWDYPMHVSVNGGYRWANKNNPNTWWVGGCLGASF